jgi:hypothetical protein
MSKKVPLLLSDIYDENGMKSISNPIYYNGIRVGEPEQSGSDMIIFNLTDGTKHEVYLYEDTETTEDGDEFFPGMQISYPIKGYVSLTNKNNKLIGHGGKKKSKRYRKKSKRKCKKSRKHKKVS